MLDWLPSFFEELSKLAGNEDLPPSARARQYLQFGALGAGTGLAVGGLGNYIQRSRFSPYGVKLRRWIPAQMATGALFGGALPVVQDLLRRSNLAKAERGREAHEALQAMTPEGPSLALKNLQPQSKVLEL